MSLVIFYLSQNIWQIVDILENLLIISPLILLHVCHLFPKMFLKCVIPTYFFMSADSAVCCKYNFFFFTRCYEFFVILLTCEFILWNFVSYDIHSVQFLQHLMCYLLEKSRKIPFFWRWDAKGIYKSRKVPNDMLQVGRLLLQSSFICYCITWSPYTVNGNLYVLSPSL